MKQNAIRYLILSLGILVFGITIVWLIKHFQDGNLTKIKLEKDYYSDIARLQEGETIRDENRKLDFEIEAGEIVYIKYRQGKEISNVIKHGNIKILDEQAKVVFEYALPAEDVSQKLDLPAGKYTIIEEAETDKDFMKRHKLEKERKAGITEQEVLTYSFEVWKF